MSKEKQIVDIRGVIANCDDVPDDVCRFKPCSLCKAERIYNAGYRKQSEGEWVRLPCKIGDTVYVPDRCGRTEEISPYQITNLTITQNKKGVWTKKYRAMWLKNGKTVDAQYNFEFEEIGKTVFLTKEEAEKALAERK